MGHGVMVRTGRTGGKGNCGQDVKKKNMWFGLSQELSYFSAAMIQSMTKVT